MIFLSGLLLNVASMSMSTVSFLVELLQNFLLAEYFALIYDLNDFIYVQNSQATFSKKDKISKKFELR